MNKILNINLKKANKNGIKYKIYKDFPLFNKKQCKKYNLLMNP